MNKSMMRVALVITLLSSDLVQAATSQFRSPLSFIKHGAMHFPLEHVENAWWMEQMPHQRCDTKWRLESFKGLYGRSASKSFYDECEPCEDKVTHKTVSLSKLWFGKEAFRGEDVFPGGMLQNPCAPALQQQENISLGFSRITPRFEYNEYGAYFGGDANYTLGKNGQWRIGGRASMPIKVIEIERDQDQQLYETVDDVARMRQIVQGQAPGDGQYDFAARFDFLNTLSYNVGAPAACTPFVQYNQGNRAVAMNGFVSGTAPSNANVYAIASCNGALPDQPFRQVPSASIGELPADGALRNGSVAFFKDGVDYESGVGSDRQAQGLLFIVPRANNDNTGLANTQTSQELYVLLEQINALGVSSPVTFFNQAGNINLGASERITGQGDIFTEVYGGYQQPAWFADAIIGLRLPTGTKTDKANRIFLQSTGNNAHVELKLGVDGGWKVCNWFAFEVDAAFHHAFNRTEQRAAPYKGATVKNIGPSVGVDISWNYFTAHVNLNFFHPCNPELGCMFGYDLMAKRKNKVCLPCPPPDDLLGRSNSSLPLDQQGYDASLLSKNSDAVTHKLRSEVFHRWNFCELFAGAGQVLFGKNAMKESEAYLGMTVYF